MTIKFQNTGGLISCDRAVNMTFNEVMTWLPISHLLCSITVNYTQLEPFMASPLLTLLSLHVNPFSTDQPGARSFTPEEIIKYMSPMTWDNYGCVLQAVEYTHPQFPSPLPRVHWRRTAEVKRRKRENYDFLKLIFFFWPHLLDIDFQARNQI